MNAYRPKLMRVISRSSFFSITIILAAFLFWPAALDDQPQKNHPGIFQGGLVVALASGTESETAAADAAADSSAVQKTDGRTASGSPMAKTIKFASLAVAILLAGIVVKKIKLSTIAGQKPAAAPTVPPGSGKKSD